MSSKACTIARAIRRRDDMDLVPFSVEIGEAVLLSHYAIFFSVMTAASRALRN